MSSLLFWFFAVVFGAVLLFAGLVFLWISKEAIENVWINLLNKKKDKK